MEVFHFSKTTSEVLKQSLMTLSTQIQSMNAPRIFNELAQCLIEARVSDEEFSRRELLREIDTKLTNVSRDNQPNSFAKLCHFYDLIIVLPLMLC